MVDFSTLCHLQYLSMLVLHVAMLKTEVNVCSWLPETAEVSVISMRLDCNITTDMSRRKLEAHAMYAMGQVKSLAQLHTRHFKLKLFPRSLEADACLMPRVLDQL